MPQRRSRAGWVLLSLVGTGDRVLWRVVRGLLKSGLNFLTYIAKKKNRIHINNLNLFKEVAHEKTLEVLDLHLV